MAREMINSGVQWIGEIPSNWGMSPNKYLMHKIKQICPTYNDEDILSLSVRGVNVRDLDAGGKMPTTFDGYQRVYKGNLLMCLFDMDVTPCCIGRIKNDGLTSPAYSQFVVHKDANRDYYYYYYLMLDNTKELVHLAKNLRHSLTEEQLGNIKLPLPPLNEQKAIADFLDAKCGEIDGLLADLDAEVKTLGEYKKSIIAETVTRGLNPNAQMKPSGISWADAIPVHWDIDKGKFHFELRRTKGNPQNLELMSPTQKYGVIPQSQLEGVVLVKEKTDLGTFRTIRKGDFCISLRSFQGGFEYSKYEGVVSPAYQVFYPIKPIVDGYFKYLFKSDGFISFINTFSMSLRDGKNIAFEDFGNSYIPIPPIEEQEAIANYLDEKCAAIEQSIADKQTQIETLKAYKSSLIYEYVTGKKQVI